jgi:hypothetical protein
MLSPLIGRTDIDCRTFTKSESSEITCAGKVRRNNGPQEISHLIVKPCAVGLGCISRYENRNDTFAFEVQAGREPPVFA